MQDLKVTLVQSKIFWEDKKKNFAHFGNKIESIKEKTNLIILPEMFSTGFTMNAPRFADKPKGEAYDFLKYYSNKKKSCICGSVIVKEKNKYYNRLLLSFPDGKVFHYDKRHLFRMAEENLVYSGGNKKLIVKIKEWRVALFICYDLRFPVWLRNKNNYDLAVFIANWPERRAYHWKSLLLARAIENQSYVAGVNRIGKDGNKINYTGDSAVINPLGEYVINAKNKSGTFTAVLSKKTIDNYKKNFPAHKDSDKFEIKS
jgi:predicted amidohydrolase